MSTYEQEVKEILPREISCIINEYLQHAYRILFDRVIKTINDMTFNKEGFYCSNKLVLRFKPKYAKIIGKGTYAIVHRTYNDGIRIGSIQPHYEGVNSILLNPIKILLYMRLYDNDQDEYDDADWEMFFAYYVGIEEVRYDIFNYLR